MLLALAAPIDKSRRPEFMSAVTMKLEAAGPAAIGPGAVHRVARAMLGGFWSPPPDLRQNRIGLGALEANGPLCSAAAPELLEQQHAPGVLPPFEHRQSACRKHHHRLEQFTQLLRGAGIELRVSAARVCCDVLKRPLNIGVSSFLEDMKFRTPGACPTRALSR